jgi:DNA mismatch repair protein MSH5
MNDLQQISLCLKEVTSRSLVIIDEFGKGTNESSLSIFMIPHHFHLLTLTDGIGLACGILEYLLNLEPASKVIAATHFHEIFENDFLALRPRLQLGHMEVQVGQEIQQVEDQVTYLYKYVQCRWPLIYYSTQRTLTDRVAFVSGEVTSGTMHVSRFPFPVCLPALD